MDISNSYKVNCFGCRTLIHKLEQNVTLVVNKEIFYLVDYIIISEINDFNW
jgi:hypothetical protein